MKISLKDIFIQFVIIGLQLLGGGYVIVPLMKKYIIENKKWITDEDLTNFYALSQSIPGIIAANISTFAGYKLRGKIGAAVALFGIITTPIITIISIALILDKLLNFRFIESIFWGVGISVIILIFLSIKEIWQNSMKDKFSWFIFTIAIILSIFFKFSPVKIIISCVLIGVIVKIFLNKRKNV